MSGILGIYHRNGQVLGLNTLNEMLQSLQHRGPDGLRSWQGEFVGLGHCMLQTTPESLFEELPFQHQGCVITADARIDNREELYTLLEALHVKPLSELTDSDLILAAYLRWGQACPGYLLGDFVFAIWDQHKQVLFCARDHFGVKPFYYYQDETIFAFASEAKALFMLPQVPYKINELRIVDYLIGNFADTEMTSFEHVLRLSPASWLMATAEAFTMESYWQLDPTREIKLDSDAAYAARFLEIFTEAVRCRLRSAFPIASTLSGGLDSSAVTCVARQLLAERGLNSLFTLSGIFDQVTACDERQYIDKVIEQGGLHPLYFHGDAQGPLSNIDEILTYQDEAFHGVGIATMVWPMYRVAQQKKIRVVLEGHDGDTTVSHGYGRLVELPLQRQWLTLFREMCGVSRIYQEPMLKSFFVLLWKLEFQPFLRKIRLMQVFEKLRSFLSPLVRPKQSNSEDLTSFEVPINKVFAEKIGFDQRSQVARQMGFNFGKTERQMHHRAITQGLQTFALEIFSRAAPPFSLEARYPFWDKRLVEFCLALPSDQKLHQGWTRYVMRNAMKGVMPEAICWRTSKMDFVPNLIHGLLKINAEDLENILAQETQLVGQYLDIEEVHICYRALKNSEDAIDSKQLLKFWQAIFLTHWLSFSKGRSCLTSHSKDLDSTPHPSPAII
jgi:asparagine synthase (glutamine-hydrolysing)